MGASFSTMAGLRGGARYGSPPSGPVSPSQAAYGPNFTSPVASVGNILAPNDPFGIALWTGVAGAAALIYLYFSLPN